MSPLLCIYCLTAQWFHLVDNKASQFFALYVMLHTFFGALAAVHPFTKGTLLYPVCAEEPWLHINKKQCLCPSVGCMKTHQQWGVDSSAVYSPFHVRIDALHQESRTLTKSCLQNTRHRQLFTRYFEYLSSLRQLRTFLDLHVLCLYPRSLCYSFLLSDPSISHHSNLAFANRWLSLHFWKACPCWKGWSSNSWKRPAYGKSINMHYAFHYVQKYPVDACELL